MKACINHGFGALNLDQIVGRAMQANIGSVRMMEKAQMQHIGQREFDGNAGVIYAISASKWDALSALID